LGHLGALFEGAKPTKAPCGDWTGFRFRTGVTKTSLAMYPSSISIDEHVPLKFLMTKTLLENNKNVFTNKHIIILKIIFNDICINISK